jgi:hypothetical protein
LNASGPNVTGSGHVGIIDNDENDARSTDVRKARERSRAFVNVASRRFVLRVKVCDVRHIDARPS